MKLSKISTDTLWGIFRIQLKVAKEISPSAWDPSDDELERILSDFPLAGGIRRKAILYSIRESESMYRDIPSFFSEVCETVYSELGVDYRDIVTSPATMIKKILKRFRIANKQEYYLVRELLSDMEYMEYRTELSAILGKYEKDG